ncbi:Sugar ABC transporter, ATP-binding protein [Pseudonocardia sp. Ae168_Ps1]|uniref:ABC transporter ATP-binding protein n=1 Tax=unclassified Pseudonocardia TaxID=2619320 RepID=UPI00094B49F5|nr:MULTISPECIES: ABC transporter ATP-binding protein [unclassified Pseudonocardia]OLL72045.1 Sugar ABC transporter, ATP-binding protein [Pseudonocardia sp. Ae150A_Ps1]OLL78011.1 Sugar ABC transporter, ATP-binding protein [Pseudonocardia sp. Ae168_Ps1]OLL87864.1 Sugar ABC transporter, ATP-binding protein [Pseudonocardia sp. Ae263_Ps1]OLL92110.1 Sugar ABC transporter, ATP-binding protein [Pseudonocardia sp. Ae356_Ps1]
MTLQKETADPGQPTVPAVTTAAGIELLGVRHRYGPTLALDVDDLAVPHGSLTVIVGPSGCGKSTLLSVVAGLLSPGEGRVRIGGTDVTDTAPGGRGLAMVFQDYALYPHLSVAANIGFGMRLEARHSRGAGPGRAEIDRRVDEVSAQLGLAGLLERRPAQLSGGQRQRVALARAIVRRRPVLLLDEPLSSLDAQLRAQARTELARLHRELGATLVMVTHDQSKALSIATHLIVMRAGRVVQAAAPDEVYRRPHDEFVATFVGSPPMNVLDHDRARWGWRPADGAVLGDGDTPEVDAMVLDGTVDVVEFAGHDRLVHCRSREGRWSFTEPIASGRAVGDHVRVSIAARDLHRFDPGTGRRVGCRD